MVKVDLGCGKAKPEGFIGVDRYPMPGVDIVADLDAPLPIASDSVDLLYASHSLEHVRDLMATMREVYRVCKHGAQVCIVAPYYEQKLNLANPYHVWAFNEHTPRFWTDYPYTPVEPEEYRHPQGHTWGLSRTDNSNPGLDLRLVDMECFYFPQYLGLPAQRLRELRHTQTDVCDQILYHLIVWKGDGHPPGRTFDDYVADFVPFEPNYVKKRKIDERGKMIQARIEEQEADKRLILDLQSQLARLAASREAEVAAASRRLAELGGDLERSGRLLDDMRGENHQLRMRLSGHYEKAEVLADQFHAANTALAKSRLEAESLAQALAGVRGENAALQCRLALLNSELDASMAAFSQANTDAAGRFKVLTQENAELRARIESIDALKAKNALLDAEIEAASGLLAWYQARESALSAEANAMATELAVAQSAHGRWEYSESVAKSLCSQLEAFHAQPSALFAIEDMAWNLLPTGFDEMKRSSLVAVPAARRRLAISGDLRTMPYREYLIRSGQAAFHSIAVALRPLSLPTRGLAGIEIVSAARKVVAQAVLPLSSVNPATPTTFNLPSPLAELEPGWALRVFVKEADVPVAVLEQARRSRLRRHVSLLPFALLR